MSNCTIYECNNIRDFQCENNFYYKHNKDIIEINSFDVNCKIYVNLKLSEMLLDVLINCSENEHKKIIASFIISDSFFIFCNVKDKCVQKNNMLYVIYGKLDKAHDIIYNSLKTQMYFNVYESARQDELCRHLSKNLNLTQIQFDGAGNKFILLFESDNKTLLASINYLTSINSVSTDLNFIKNNKREFLCINKNPLFLCIVKKNEYKIIVHDLESKSKKIYVVTLD